MKKESALKAAVVALLVLNLGTLGFLFSRHKHGRPMPFDKQIIETLKLDDTQQNTFKTLKNAHHEQMLASDRAYSDALKNYFGLLNRETVPPAVQDSLLRVLTSIQKDRAVATYAHFSDLKALCTPEQKKRFETLLPEVMGIILPHKDDKDVKK